MGIFTAPETPGEMFIRFDTDKSGTLEVDEVKFGLAEMGALRKTTAGEAATICREAFADKPEGSGLDMDEFKLLLAKVEMIGGTPGKKKKEAIKEVEVPYGYKSWDGSLPTKSAFMGFAGSNGSLSLDEWNEMMTASKLVDDVVDEMTTGIIFARACKKGKRMLNWKDGTFLNALAALATEHKVGWASVADRVADSAPLGSPELKSKSRDTEAAKMREQRRQEALDAKLMEAFSRYDVDGNGTLDLQEMGAALADMGAMQNVDVRSVRNLFKEFDADESGDIDFGEFKSLCGRVEEIKKKRAKAAAESGGDVGDATVPPGFASTPFAIALKKTFDSFVEADQTGVASAAWAELLKETRVLFKRDRTFDEEGAELIFNKAFGPTFHDTVKTLKWDDGTFFSAVAAVATELKVTFDLVAGKIARYGPFRAARSGGGYECVALVSGGKDSVFAAMMAQSHGHRIVAMANLYPANNGVEELDSHCFQTVGHRCVASYGALTGLPLFRRKIRGASVNTDMAYDVHGAVDGGVDEVEDLRALLAGVVRAMPNVKAVCSGAILSDYQRLRMEAVCADLGLVSLSYLWRQPQSSLLERMCDSNVEAVLIKTAAMGLQPTRDLGKTIKEMLPTLYEIEKKYGSHCAGEGGEFETLALDCPLFTRGRLHIAPNEQSLLTSAPEVIITSEDTLAPAGHLAIVQHAVEVKQGMDWMVEGKVVEVDTDAPPPRRVGVSHEEAAVAAAAADVLLSEVDVRETWGITNRSISARVVVMNEEARNTPAAAAASAEALLLAVQTRLRRCKERLDWSAVAFVHLYVNNMDYFSSVNAAYARVVPSCKPPARACVELPLPEGVVVALDVHVSVADPAPSRSLHVQGISCWAPPCIGPYGQAVSAHGLTYLAGCIGMEPATLNVVDAASEARRSWRTAAAVARVMGSPLWRDCLCTTVYVSVVGGDDAMPSTMRAFEEVLAGAKWQDDVDVPGGDLHVAAGVPAGRRRDDSSADDEEGDDGRGDVRGGDEGEDDHEEVASASKAVGGDGSAAAAASSWPWEWRPLVTAVVVPKLPKDASCEVQPVLLDGDGPNFSTRYQKLVDPWDGDVDQSRAEIVMESHDVGFCRCVSLSREGRFCRATAATPSDADATIALKSIVMCVAIALDEVEDVRWRHVCMLKCYATTEWLEAFGEREDRDGAAALADALDALIRNSALSYGKGVNPFGVRVVVVPVVRASFDSVTDAGMVLELSAIVGGGDL